eukprot:5617712-Pyramimonas_sp.AAC.1
MPGCVSNQASASLHPAMPFEPWLLLPSPNGDSDKQYCRTQRMLGAAVFARRRVSGGLPGLLRGSERT